MNANYGLLPPLEETPRKKADKNLKLAERALRIVAGLADALGAEQARVFDSQEVPVWT
jgi:folate-dependent tRNA-U54 methylase TrmFO/GidA